MHKTLALVALTLALGVHLDADARGGSHHYYGAYHGAHHSSTRHSYPRDRHVRADFQHQHPCPSTGKRSGHCPGYVVDHVKPLCKGGADASYNMQWQSTAAAKAKDQWECRR